MSSIMNAAVNSGVQTPWTTARSAAVQQSITPLASAVNQSNQFTISTPPQNSMTGGLMGIMMQMMTMMMSLLMSNITQPPVQPDLPVSPYEHLDNKIMKDVLGRTHEQEEAEVQNRLRNTVPMDGQYGSTINAVIDRLTNINPESLEAQQLLPRLALLMDAADLPDAAKTLVFSDLRQLELIRLTKNLDFVSSSLEPDSLSGRQLKARITAIENIRHNLDVVSSEAVAELKGEEFHYVEMPRAEEPLKAPAKTPEIRPAERTVPVKPAVETRPAPVNFDEEYYLQQYPDVAAAVRRGEFASGLQHYQRHGASERRSPNANFNESYYLQQYPDVAAAVSRGEFKSGFEHYQRHGASENRNPNGSKTKFVA